MNMKTTELDSPLMILGKCLRCRISRAVGLSQSLTAGLLLLPKTMFMAAATLLLLPQAVLAEPCTVNGTQYECSPALLQAPTYEGAWDSEFGSGLQNDPGTAASITLAKLSAFFVISEGLHAHSWGAGSVHPHLPHRSLR